MREQQRIADSVPGPLAARPGSEQLDWITFRLRPASIGLNGFIETPAEIELPRAIDIAGGYRTVPVGFPRIQSAAGHSVNIGRAADLMMTHDTRLEEYLDGTLGTEPRFHREALQHAGKLGRKHRSNVTARRQ